MPGKKEWFHVFFDSFRPMFGFMSPQATAKQVRNIIKKLGLKPGMKFLDCPCGIGRVSRVVDKNPRWMYSSLLSATCH